jgi:hypothetical protein
MRDGTRVAGNFTTEGGSRALDKFDDLSARRMSQQNHIKRKAKKIKESVKLDIFYWTLSRIKRS